MKEARQGKAVTGIIISLASVLSYKIEGNLDGKVKNEKTRLVPASDSHFMRDRACARDARPEINR
jgi:hypothetical protein